MGSGQWVSSATSRTNEPLGTTTRWQISRRRPAKGVGAGTELSNNCICFSNPLMLIQADGPDCICPLPPAMGGH